jgi:ABC-type polysaccharide/polyol phosphate transport system ATPase subunit
MKNPVISLKDVSKSFTLWSDRTDSIKTLLINLLKFKKSKTTKKNIDVLQNVSFDIYPGEFVGIMGHNGAGKSTILKIISGIYVPTQGKVDILGKIAPLLELGAGFTDELSGYDNIFLNAAMLGFGKKRTMDLVDSIIEFSELGDRIHTPVRNYSSGMTVRLAFSIAVHLDAQILLFDEVLAVGDVSFQEKCISKIMQLHGLGKTIILITHSPEIVEKFCDRCIVISNKRKIYDGNPVDGVAIYRETTRHYNLN